MEKIIRYVNLLLILLVRLYQYTIALVIRPCCRFHPSCSCYAVDALKEHNVVYAMLLIFYRLLRCHPWHPGGYDPVPCKRR